MVLRIRWGINTTKEKKFTKYEIKMFKTTNNALANKYNIQLNPVSNEKESWKTLNKRRIATKLFTESKSIH